MAEAGSQVTAERVCDDAALPYVGLSDVPAWELPVCAICNEHLSNGFWA